MNYEFTKLSEVESLSEVPETATVLAEVDGTIKRIPSSGLGGTFKTAIIKQVDFDDAVAYFNSEVSENSISPMSAMSNDPEFSCINMTFEEAYKTILAGEPLDVVIMCIPQFPVIAHCYVGFAGVQMTGEPTIVLIEDTLFNNIQLMWTADGIHTAGGSNPS